MRRSAKMAIRRILEAYPYKPSDRDAALGDRIRAEWDALYKQVADYQKKSQALDNDAWALMKEFQALGRETDRRIGSLEGSLAPAVLGMVRSQGERMAQVLKERIESLQVLREESAIVNSEVVRSSNAPPKDY